MPASEDQYSCRESGRGIILTLYAPDDDQDELVPDASSEDGLCLEGQSWEGGLMLQSD